MEGYLKKWVNIVSRWQDRYFILNDNILHYCDQKGGQSKGQIHLKVSAIILVPEDPLRIIINTGTNEIQVRAANVTEKIEWVNSLKRAQEDCQETLPRDCMKEVNHILTDIWVTQAAFDETLSVIVSKLERQQNFIDLASKLSELGSKIKMNVTLCTQMLEMEKEKLYTDNETVFQSFHNTSNRQEDFNRHSSISSASSLSISNILEPIRNEQPIKYKNLINNPVFQKIQFTNQQIRSVLPRTQDPNEKVKVWSFIKELIGKDLSKFAVPVQFNEPLSMLQRLAENLEYYQTLIDANKESDQWLRLCYVMGFGVSAYAGNIDRHKKPFNPILGETFEIQNKSFRFVSEQVSHHPPISAGYADSPDFELQMQTDLKTKMSPRTMEVQPTGSVYIKLKQHNDQISYNKCITKVHNIIFGNMYIEHIGDMVYNNNTTSDRGVLTLSENHKMSGIVYDRAGREKYKLRGAWNDSLIAINVATGRETQVWKKNDLPQDARQYFFFTQFAMNLNLLNVDLIQQLPCTDCRLRPDQLALEYGFIDLAADEKFRLEQKQRQRRKELQISGQKHVPAFFELAKEPTSNETIYKYKGNYWREKGEGLDLF